MKTGFPLLAFSMKKKSLFPVRHVRNWKKTCKDLKMLNVSGHIVTCQLHKRNDTKLTFDCLILQEMVLASKKSFNQKK